MCAALETETECRRNHVLGSFSPAGDAIDLTSNVGFQRARLNRVRRKDRPMHHNSRSMLDIWHWSSFQSYPQNKEVSQSENYRGRTHA